MSNWDKVEMKCIFEKYSISLKQSCTLSFMRNGGGKYITYTKCTLYLLLYFSQYSLWSKNTHKGIYKQKEKLCLDRGIKAFCAYSSTYLQIDSHRQRIQGETYQTEDLNTMLTRQKANS